MRVIAFSLAAVFSFVGIAAQWFGWPRTVGVCGIILAGLFLAWGFYDVATARTDEPIELDAEQRATVRRMKKEGNTHLAIQQVQLWFRNTSPEDAARIVRAVE